jgi:mono/diheme cytochrome c family protein
LLEKTFMKNRNTAWIAAAAVTVTTLQLILFATFLPQPAAATDLATPPTKVSAVTGRADPVVARGQYLVSITGCHDCHTGGYAETGGDVPAKRWLTGQALGYQGPWGVSYPSNLRLSVQNISEAQWLVFARAPRRPPMPWFALRDMSDDDLRAVYRFIRTLGPAGEQAPAPLAPGAAIATPYISMVPANLPLRATP